MNTAEPDSPKCIAAYATATLVATAVVAHSAPGVTAIGPFRRVAFRTLSGISDSYSVALTFDDGPDSKSTPLFLERLSELGWKATFFMLGSMAIKNPSLVREVHSQGHEIALHGYHHKNLLFRTPGATREDIRKGLDTITEIAEAEIRFYRPPYGVFNTQSLLTTKELGLSPVLWTAWGRDWRAKATPKSVMGDLSKHLGPGSTLLLHDSDCTSAKESYLSTLGALDLLKFELSKRSLSVERLCDHLQTYTS